MDTPSNSKGHSISEIAVQLQQCSFLLDGTCSLLHNAFMSDINTLLHRAHAYAKARGLKPSTVSRILFGNGERMGEIEKGGSLRMDTFHRATQKLDELEATPSSSEAVA